MIIKIDQNKSHEFDIPTIKKTKSDIIKELMVRYKYLIEKDLINDKKYSNRLKVFNYILNEELEDTLIFCPEELINSFILSIILKYTLISNLKIYRSSDISDIAFGKNDTVKGIQYIREKYIIVIVDNNTTDYIQTLLVQLYENRIKKGYITIFVFNFETSDIDKFPTLDTYLFPDGETSRNNFITYNIYEIREEYGKRWNINAKSNKNNTDKK